MGLSLVSNGLYAQAETQPGGGSNATYAGIRAKEAHPRGTGMTD